jgi:uncharacterized membrane protein
VNTEPRPETAREFLAELRLALKGCSPGLIADALADADEHLRGEIAAQPDRPERDVLASVIETYGTPAEIAEEYKAMESTISGPFPKSEGAPQPHHGFFGIVRDPGAYGALMYMLLSLATGIFYFTWTVTGLALTTGFSILIIGIPFALLFIGSIRVLSHVEGRIVEGLLGVRMPRRLPLGSSADESLWSRIKSVLLDIRTWSSMAYLVLMLPLGIVYFTIALVGIVVPFTLVGASIYGLVTGHVHVSMSEVPWLEHVFHTAPGLLLTIFIGIALLFIMLNLAKLIGWLHGLLAETLLVRL